MPTVIPFTRTLITRLRGLGIDPACLFEKAGLGASRLAAETRLELTTEEFFAIWQALEESGSADVGLRIASAGSAELQDVVTAVALHAASLGDALAKVARYKRLVCPEDMLVELTDDTARVRYAWRFTTRHPPARLVDAALASAFSIARRGMGDPTFTPVRVELSRRREHADMFADHFGCTVQFDASYDTLVLPLASLQISFVTRNAEFVEVMTPGLEAAFYSALQQTPKTIADDARRFLIEQMRGERPTVDRLARRMHLSPRTLQRRLEEVGTSYQALLDEVRKHVAGRLLEATDLDIGEIAFLLGFEELSSFSRSFQNWEGTTPTRYRASKYRT